MSNRQILRQAQTEVRNGKDRQEVFATYQSQVTKPQHLAVAIASIPHQDLRQKWQILNGVLVALLVIAGLAKALGLYMELGDQNMALRFGLILVGLLFSGAFAVGVAQFNGQIYTLLVILCVAGFLQILNHFHGDYLGAALDAAFVTVIMVLSILLKRKIFPNLRLGGVKQDPSGKYLL